METLKFPMNSGLWLSCFPLPECPASQATRRCSLPRPPCPGSLAHALGSRLHPASPPRLRSPPASPLVALGGLCPFKRSFQTERRFPAGLAVKESTCQGRGRAEAAWTPGPGSSPAGGPGNPLQRSALERPMDIGARGLPSLGSPRVGHG